MPCKNCGLSAVNETKGAKWVKCLALALGATEELAAAGWSAKLHGKLYAAAEANRAAIEAAFPAAAGFTDPGYGNNAKQTTGAAVAILVADAAVRSSFFDCVGIAAADAVAQVTAKSGDYYEAMMSGLAMIFAAESPGVQYAGNGPAAAILLVVGSFGTMVGFARK